MRTCKHVVYVDPVGKDHDAITTNDFGGDQIEFPSLNVVYVTDDKEKHDSYGQQIERATSVPHESNRGGAHGNFWKDS